MDLTENDRTSETSFQAIVDTKNGEACPDIITAVLLNVINGCTKRVPKWRPTIDEVINYNIIIMGVNYHNYYNNYYSNIKSLV